MKITGLITEYNPFHNGHLYHLNKSREMTNSDYTVVVMSGDFMQRGAPAVINKYDRTRMALACGADLVLELPVQFSCASAEFFAQGGISLLNSLGCVDHLVFGTETDDIRSLMKAADLLEQESDEFRVILKKYLSQGLTFPQSRAAALSESMPDTEAGLLSSPNNILGIEYLKALKRLRSPIIPLCLKRQGKGYHDRSIDLTCSISGCPDFTETSAYASATGIRQELEHSGSLDHLNISVPDVVLDILKQRFQISFPITDSDFSSLVRYKLLTTRGTYDTYTDVTPELASRIEKFLPDYKDISSFIDVLKSKNYTRTRISRCLMHILLDMKKGAAEMPPAVPYARVLGFCRSSSALLSEIHKNTAIPLITKVADAPHVLKEWYSENEDLQNRALESFQKDLLAADIYETAVSHKFGIKPLNEYTHGVIIL